MKQSDNKVEKQEIHLKLAGFSFILNKDKKGKLGVSIQCPVEQLNVKDVSQEELDHVLYAFPTVMYLAEHANVIFPKRLFKEVSKGAGEDPVILEAGKPSKKVKEYPKVNLEGFVPYSGYDEMVVIAKEFAKDGLTESVSERLKAYKDYKATIMVDYRGE